MLFPGHSFITLVEGTEKDEGQRKKQILHTSMVSKVCGEIQEKVQQDARTRAVAPEPRITEYDLTSPLLGFPLKKGGEIPSVHPFWAVIKCKSPKSVYNMEPSMQTIIVPQTALKGAPKHMLVTTVSLPVLKNCEALEKDDVLTVQYAEDEEEC